MNEPINLDDIDPGYFHVLRAAADDKILAALKPEQLMAIRRLMCPVCRLGVPVVLTSTATEPFHDHTVDGHTTQCRAGGFFREFYRRVRAHEEKEMHEVSKRGQEILNKTSEKAPPITEGTPYGFRIEGESTKQTAVKSRWESP